MFSKCAQSRLQQPKLKSDRWPLIGWLYLVRVDSDTLGSALITPNTHRLLELTQFVVICYGVFTTTLTHFQPSAKSPVFLSITILCVGCIGPIVQVRLCLFDNNLLDRLSSHTLHIAYGYSHKNTTSPYFVGFSWLFDSLGIWPLRLGISLRNHSFTSNILGGGSRRLSPPTRY